MAYTEYYCQSGGSNINAGSTTSNTAAYTHTSGNWVNSTGVFTPTDGRTTSSFVSVGMFASVYVDAATEGVYIGRVSAVGAGVNGTITCNTVPVGTKPTDGTGNRSIKVGGAFQGPNAASGFPLTLGSGSTGWGMGQDSTSHRVRLNLRNDQTYTMTASFAVTTSNSPYTIQGYTTNPGDGGRATFDGTTSTGAIISTLGVVFNVIEDCIFTTSITTGTTVDLVITAVASIKVINCVFTGARRFGLAVTAASSIIEQCEAYGCNVNGNANGSGFSTTGNGTSFFSCIAHDNSATTSQGFIVNGATNTVFVRCIADTNLVDGISVINSGSIYAVNCDLYNNNTGVHIATAIAGDNLVENCNFFKNPGAGINNGGAINAGRVLNNTYGAGTQANGANVLGNFTEAGAVNYTSNLTPWTDPANGKFTQQPAVVVGYGTFTTTAASYGPTVGYPLTGAAPMQRLTSGGVVT